MGVDEIDARYHTRERDLGASIERADAVMSSRGRRGERGGDGEDATGRHTSSRAHLAAVASIRP